MATDPQHLLEAHIPWYRTRKFWIIVLTFCLIFSTFLFIQFLDKNGSDFKFSINQIFVYATFSYGGTFLFLLGFGLLGSVGKLIGTILYIVSSIYLIYKTLKSSKVQILYPLIFLVLYSIGIVTTLFFPT